MDVNDIFPTQQIAAIDEHIKPTWLIENIWLENSCGIIGGQPKCYKSWFGLDMAISVASGTECLKKYPVQTPGTSLVFMAEEKIEEVKKRVSNLANSRNITLTDLPLHLITAPSIRLDNENDRKKLDATLKFFKPRLLILDPLVRLHRLDENSAHEISGLLGYLRELQRNHEISIVLTHHSSKRQSNRPGQGLRGSSDLHAFGDSNVYLSRKNDNIELSLEHRSAAPIDPVRLKLVTSPHIHLSCTSMATEIPIKFQNVEEKVIQILKEKRISLKRSGLREQLRINNQNLGLALKNLLDQNLIRNTEEGYQLVSK